MTNVSFAPFKEVSKLSRAAHYENPFTLSERPAEQLSSIRHIPTTNNNSIAVKKSNVQGNRRTHVDVNITMIK